MKYLESIVGGIIGMVIVIMIALFIALGILIVGLTGNVSFKKNDIGKTDICINNKILHDMVSKGEDDE